MTQTAPTPQQHPPGDDALTQPLLELAEQGLSTREIAARLPISQSAVSRRLRRLREQNMMRRRQFWQTAMYVLLTASAVTIAVAVAILAFQH